MSNYKTVIFDSGPAIRYEIKKVFGAHFLLINTNFKPLEHPTLVESEWLSIEGIERMDSTGIYPDNTGYVIYYLGTSWLKDEVIYNQIETKFKNYFNGKI